MKKIWTVLSTILFLAMASHARAQMSCGQIYSDHQAIHFTKEQAAQLRQMMRGPNYMIDKVLLQQYLDSGQLWRYPDLTVKIFFAVGEGLSTADSVRAFKEYDFSKMEEGIRDQAKLALAFRMVKAFESKAIWGVQTLPQFIELAKMTLPLYGGSVALEKALIGGGLDRVIASQVSIPLPIEQAQAILKQVVENPREAHGIFLYKDTVAPNGRGTERQFHVMAYSTSSLEGASPDSLGLTFKELEARPVSTLPIDKKYSVLVHNKMIEMHIQGEFFSSQELANLQARLNQSIYVDPSSNDLIEDFLRYGQPQKHPYLVAKVLMNRYFDLTKSENMALLRSLDVDSLAKDPSWKKDSQNIRASDSEILMRSVIDRYMLNQLGGIEPNLFSLCALFKNWAPLFPPWEMENVIANQLMAEMNGNVVPSIYRMIPNYNLFKMIKESVREALGEKSLVVQDIYVYKDKKRIGDEFAERNIHVIAFSNHGLDGDSVNKFGFSVKELETIPAINAQIDKIYSWSIDGKVAKAHVRYKPLDKSFLQIERQSPRYDQMISDKKLTGMVLISENLGEFSKDLSEIYTDYFVNRDFDVAEYPEMSGEEAYQFILSHIKSGEIDYSIREGHSEFQPEAMITYGSGPVHILRLTKKHSNRPYREVVYIVYPTIKKNATAVPHRSLSMSELGNALRSRKNRDQQFLYFDSACQVHAFTATRYELTAAPGFTPIASPHILSTFEDASGGAAFEFLDGVRSQRSYEEIDQRVKIDEMIALPNMGEKYMSMAQILSLEPVSLMISRNFSSEVRRRQARKNKETQ